MGCIQVLQGIVIFGVDVTVCISDIIQRMFLM